MQALPAATFAASPLATRTAFSKLLTRAFALLEAIYYRVPIVVNRYSVFVRDIEPKGFHIPAIDGLIHRNVVEEVRKIFNDPVYRHQMVDHNYEIAKKYYSYRVLRYGLQTLIKNIQIRTD